MLFIAYDQMLLIQNLAQTLTPESLGSLSGIAIIVGSNVHEYVQSTGFRDHCVARPYLSERDLVPER